MILCGEPLLLNPILTYRYPGYLFAHWWNYGGILNEPKLSINNGSKVEGLAEMEVSNYSQPFFTKPSKHLIQVREARHAFQENVLHLVQQTMIRELPVHVFPNQPLQPLNTAHVQSTSWQLSAIDHWSSFCTRITFANPRFTDIFCFTAAWN